MWHQVIDDEKSYCETSCTAMFTYAFARGVIRRKLDKRFAAAAQKELGRHMPRSDRQ